MATLSLLAISISRASLTTPDNLAARRKSPLESDKGIPVMDMVHWCHPSAEMVAESREVEP